MPVPAVDPNTILATFPETWNALVEAAKTMGTDVITLTERGITTYGALVEYMKAEGYSPVYLQTVTETFSGWAVDSAVDPSSTTDVGFRVATDIATTGGAGTAVSTFTSGGNRTLGLVTKMVALGACLSLLVSEIGAGLVADDIQEDLVTSIDPYTIDGENIPVLIDENGATHLMEDMIEAVRAKAVELGLYNSPDPVVPDVPGTGDVVYYTWTTASSYTRMTVTRARFNYAKQYCKFIAAADFKVNYNGVIYTGFYMKERSTGTRYDPDYLLVYASDANGSVNVSCFFLESNPNKPPYISGQVNYGYYVGDSPEINWGATTFSGIGVNTTTVKYLYRYQSWTLPASRNAASLNGIPTYGGSVPNLSAVHSLVAYSEIEGSSIAGMEPNSQTEALLKDLTNPFTAAFPNIGTGLDTASPTETDLTHKTKWYPVNVKHVNPFTDGLTTTDTDPATVTDGDTDTDVEDEIIELLKGLYEALNRDPEDPTQPVPPPTIEVSDSGDTPPANPPLVSGSANGLWKIYNPLEADIQAFGSWLWSSSVIDQVVRMFNSPIDAVIALHQIYCTPVRGASANIMCGFLDSGVPSTYTVANQYQTIDCGDVNVGEYYRTAVDYVATKIELYLPFIGIVPLSASVVMGSTLNVTYRIDVLTGTCLAQVKVIKQNSDAVMYTFAGNCACQIPLTATTYTGMVGTLVNSVQAGLSFMAGDIIQGAGEIGSALRDGMTGLTGTKKSGSLGANAGALGIRIPYLIITHPTVYDAYLYNEQYGYPSNKTVQLGSVSGYTKVKDIHLSGIPCTDEELAEIERLLKNGVIIN